MRIEREHDGGSVQLLGPLEHAMHNPHMATVHPVEVADGDGATPGFGRQFGQFADDVHKYG